MMKNYELCYEVAICQLDEWLNLIILCINSYKYPLLIILMGICQSKKK
jgi:hypothetical protein